MKKASLFIIIALCITVPELPAQRYLPGQQGVQITAGTVNGLNVNAASEDSAFHAGVVLSAYTRRTDRWLIGMECLETRPIYRETGIPQVQFTVEAGYCLKLFSDWRKMFFVSLGASALMGYETVNWNNKLLSDGATVNNADGFLFGGALTFEMETYLSDRIVLLVNVREQLLGGSSVGNLNTQLGLGLKFGSVPQSMLI
jgi:hypothetical protein